MQYLQLIAILVLKYFFVHGLETDDYEESAMASADDQRESEFQVVIIYVAALGSKERRGQRLPIAFPPSSSPLMKPCMNSFTHALYGSVINPQCACVRWL